MGLDFGVSLRCLQLTERMHDAAVHQKRDRVFLHSVNLSVTAVWGMGGWEVLGHLLLADGALGWYRLHQFSFKAAIECVP